MGTDPRLQEGDSRIPELGLRLHGPNVTRDAVDEAGQAMLNLIEAVAKAKGMEGEIGWQIGGAQIACDGCDFRQDFDASRVGWSSLAVDGITNDYCPACTSGMAI